MRDALVSIAAEAIGALSGETLTRDFLLRATLPPGRPVVLALGKAAAAMTRGAAAALGPLTGIAVAPGGEPVPPGVDLVPGDHPVPGPRSLAAGEALLERARTLGHDHLALVLISGGGSALAEAPAHGLDLDDVAEATRRLLASGAPIDQVNAVRRRLSRIKGGGLARALAGRPVLALAISDVHGDDPAVIASGPLHPSRAVVPPELLARLPAAVRAIVEREPTPGPAARAPALHVLAGPADLPRAAAAAAARRGIPCEVEPRFLAGDAGELARWWIERARTSTGLVAAASEPTVALPPDAGSGGRSQHLALLVARALRGTTASFLAIGSDGRDGTSDHAGAAVDGRTDDGSIAAALEAFDSARACARLGVAIPAGPTGTNLADLHLLSA